LANVETTGFSSSPASVLADRVADAGREITVRGLSLENHFELSLGVEFARAGHAAVGIDLAAATARASTTVVVDRRRVIEDVSAGRGGSPARNDECGDDPGTRPTSARTD
jgi:hypothetical protein